MKYIILILISFNLINCTKIKTKVIEKIVEAPKEEEGTDTGGGGFADQSAEDALNLAKHALAQQIENLPKDSFQPYFVKDGFHFGLPQGRRKQWLVKMIRGVNIKPVYDRRYDKPLKFNYDIEKEEIYATSYFVQNFAYGRFQNALPVEKIRLIHEIFLDILHEISHFYGVGLSEKLDYQSEYWAMDFLSYGLDSYFKCFTEKDHVLQINKATGMTTVFHDPVDPQSTLIIQKTIDHTYRREGQLSSSLFSQTINFLPRDDHWKTRIGIIKYNEYEKLYTDSAKDLYQQYVVLASQKGKKDVPDYMHPVRKKFIMNSHDHHLNFIPQYLEQLGQHPYSGSILGYPLYKEDEKKYILFKNETLKRDYFEIDLTTNTAKYMAGKKNKPEEHFVHPLKNRLTLHCQDFNKKIMISEPDKRGEHDNYWNSFIEN